jgi:hypothetical protein
MDIEQLKQRLASAARFAVEDGARRYELQMPDEFQQRQITRRHTTGMGETRRVDEPATQRDLVLLALIGWSGMRWKDADPTLEGEDGAAEMPFGPEAAALLIAQDFTIADRIAIEIYRRIADHNALLEADAKNSVRASTTSGTETKRDA